MSDKSNIQKSYQKAGVNCKYHAYVQKTTLYLDRTSITDHSDHFPDEAGFRMSSKLSVMDGVAGVLATGVTDPREEPIGVLGKRWG